MVAAYPLSYLLGPFLYIFIVAAVWDSVWKAIALWKSGRNRQLAWFVCIFIFNTVGVLPILYLIFFQKNKVREKVSGNKKRRR